MADIIDSGKISFACELDKDLETPTTESNTEARITFTETQIVLGLGNNKSIKYKATGQGTNLTNYYNKSQVDEKLKLKADKTQLSDYYNKSEIDTSLSTKVDTTTLTTNHYNKTETDNLLNNKADKTVLENYYNKSDIDGKLTNKVDTTTLDNYDLSTEVDGKVKVVSDKVGDLSTLETGVKNTVVAAINEVKRAQTEAGKVTNLNDLGDVNASSPRRGQFLGWDQDTSKWVSKDVETDGMDTHMVDFSNPHRTTISNLNDTTISTPKANQVLAYNGTKWINKDVSLDDSNYAKKNEANIFTKKQSGIDGTEDANFVTLRQLKTKVGLTGNETITGNKTFSSPIIIPNATANNHALNRVTADSRYGQLLTKNLKWTVGAGGTYLTLKQALDEACKYKALPSYTITISLKSGYTVNEDITYSYVDLGFVTITSENNEEINSSVNFNFSYSAVPKIDVVFNMTEKNKVAIFNRCLNSLTITNNGGFKNLSKVYISNSFVNINAKALTHNGSYTVYTEICRLDNVIGNFNVKSFSFDVTSSIISPYMFILRNTYIFSVFDSFISNFINGNNANIIHLINSKIYFINSNIVFKGRLSNICNLINSEIALHGVTNIKSQLPQSSIIFNFIIGSKVTKLIGFETNVTITLGNSQLSNISEGILDTKGNFLQKLI
ncbi:hypothetical protein P6X57_000799 [Campylobacter coli]|nr:hypothetical protein [Campylobacter coli]